MNPNSFVSSLRNIDIIW